jgi:predicted Zn-dependent peptidase
VRRRFRIRRPTRFAFALAAGLLATPSPSLAAAPTAASVAYERYELDNGLEVILHQDASQPSVAVNLWYHVGSGDEVPGRSGFAHLFEHMMFQGAKHIGEDAHFDRLREIGGTGINGSTNSDRTNYYEVVPAHQLETALWLESDRMGYLLDMVTAESFANQRDVVRNERRQNYDDRAYGRERFAVAAALYPEGHPYRYLTIGRHEDLEAASLADVEGFFLDWYVPSNATLVLAGRFEPTEAKALIEKWFGSFPRLKKPVRREVELPRLDSTVSSESVDPFARFERMHLAWHSPARHAEGDVELGALADALGADGRGRLYRALVVDEKLARSVNVWQRGAQRSGVFHITVTLKPGVADARARAVEIVDRELARVKAEGVDAAEVKRYGTRVETRTFFSLERLQRRAETLQSFNHYTGDPGGLDAWIARVDALTPDSVRDAANRWLGEARAEVVTIPGRDGERGAGADETSEGSTR